MKVEVVPMIKEKVKSSWNKVKNFFKKYGIDAIIAPVIWYAPSWLALFIPPLRPFALKWLGIWALPITPMYVILPLFTVFISWLRKLIWRMAMKVKVANELNLYYTLGEQKALLENGKKMKVIKDTDLKNFRDNQDAKRMKLIKENWEIELEEGDTI